MFTHGILSNSPASAEFARKPSLDCPQRNAMGNLLRIISDVIPISRLVQGSARPLVSRLKSHLEQIKAGDFGRLGIT
jgi:hypothetical protein